MKGARRPRPLPRPGEKATGHLGDRGDVSTEDVVAYLDQYKPRPS